MTDFWRRVSADGVLDDVAAGIEDDVDQSYSAQDARMLLSDPAKAAA